MDGRVTSRWLVGLAAAAMLGFFGLPLAVRGFVAAIEALLDACASLAVAVSAGASGWAIAKGVARSIVLVLATPGASGTFTALVVVAVAALWGLQRLLESEGE